MQMAVVQIIDMVAVLDRRVAAACSVLVIVMSIEVLLLLATGQGAEVEKLLGPRTLQDETKEALEAVAMARQSKP